MAIKKSELYSRLWESCDALRGGMDASQYKDYVLVMLFVKYISDKYAGQPYAAIQVPEGATFNDMVALKGKTDIGDQINKKILAPIAEKNELPAADFPDFNDSNKLGSGKEMVDRLTNLIAIFEHPDLDFSRNRTEGDDLLGDAYEYLMRHFATESGKSKGQFYTPAEVSRIMAQIIGVRGSGATSTTTVYDPTCGSGSLLLKVADESGATVSLYGQEKDVATAGLARMNMILHNFPTAQIVGGASTLADPKYQEGGQIKTFDFVVANPPFSDKRWGTGFDPASDDHSRFEGFGIPPAKQGDYAYLLHIVRSLKSAGKGACILPHGVLFRGNAEADIRKNLIRRGYIKGIIGLPANLFYGTGIPACIVVIDKENAQARKGIFMIDASQGFIKDGPKNRLRARDVHKIVDAFNSLSEIPKFSRIVSVEEIERNDFNLNLPRYIDSSEEEDIQDLEGHLKGGIPTRDIEALQSCWSGISKLQSDLFEEVRPGYSKLKVERSQIKNAIFEHPSFQSFTQKVSDCYQEWEVETEPKLLALKQGIHPKDEIQKLSESLLRHFEAAHLVDAYAIYQHLMDFWVETMQDDFYLISADGWVAKPYRIIETKNGKQKDKGWDCDLIPKKLLIDQLLSQQQSEVDALRSEVEQLEANLEQIEEENSGEEGLFADIEKVNAAEVKALLKSLFAELSAEDKATCQEYVAMAAKLGELKKTLKERETQLDGLALKTYERLTEADVKKIVVEAKWLKAVEDGVHQEVDRISGSVTQRVKELAERYDDPLPALTKRVGTLEDQVANHLKKMGFAW